MQMQSQKEFNEFLPKNHRNINSREMTGGFLG
jgi:hypothetical protein